ncbi:homeobox protein MSX-1 [Pelomyxa schiedti]|nr:homeobox protein MSX-1 [Pelomyxa schiedti]
MKSVRLRRFIRESDAAAATTTTTLASVPGTKLVSGGVEALLPAEQPRTPSQQQGLSLVMDAAVPGAPQPEEGGIMMVRVKVFCCVITREDIALMRGEFKEVVGEADLEGAGYCPGCHFSGVVDSIFTPHSGEMTSYPALLPLSFQTGDEVIGCVSLSSGGALAEYITVPWFCLVHKPPGISHQDATASVCGLITTYTALYSRCNAKPGEYILILGAATDIGYIAIQVASQIGLHIIATVNNTTELQVLGNININTESILDLSSGKPLFDTVNACTGQLGVDYVLDLLATPTPTPTILKCLAPQGHWLTTHNSLQLDPPEAHLLHLKGGTLSFLFEPVWSLFPTQHGRFHHRLSDGLDKRQSGTISSALGLIPSFSLPQIHDAVVRRGPFLVTLP